MVLVTYRRWSFTRGSNFKALMGKVLVSWIYRRLLMGFGRLLEVAEHGCSTVFTLILY